MEADLMLPPGFRFHPTDEELVRHYLCRKCSGMPIPIPIIAEIDLYKYNPWQLPGMALYGEKEWYFFSPRDRKYPNGSRPNRAAGAGYWKATGADKAVGTPKPMAIKKALVFYAGKAPKGEKTNWIMHEYRLAGVDRSARKKQSLRLDEWVLCRIYNKKGPTNTPASPDRKPAAGSRLFRSPQPPPPITYSPKLEMCTSDMPAPPSLDEFFSFDTAVPLPHLLTDSSCSEHVTSAEFTCDREVQSQLNWAELEQALDIPGGDVDPTAGFMETGDAWDPLQDIFMYLRKPF